MGDFKPLEITLSPTAKYTTGVVYYIVLYCIPGGFSQIHLKLMHGIFVVVIVYRAPCDIFKVVTYGYNM